jgi:cytochrome c553
MNNVLKHALISISLLALAQGGAAAGNPSAGETKAAVCSACHGSDGNSSAPNFPKIAGLGANYLYKQLGDIKNGDREVAEMTGLLDGFSDQDLQDLAAYFSAKELQLSGAREIKVQLNSGVKADGLKLGRQVYRSGNLETGVPACSGCHSPTGKGNAPAGFPRLGGQFTAYIEKQLRAFRAGDRTNDGDQQIMRQVAEHMSDAEIIAVSNYISGLN